MKVNPDGSLASLKARLVAKRYAQNNGVDYFETFYPLANMCHVSLLIYMAASHH